MKIKISERSDLMGYSIVLYEERGDRTFIAEPINITLKEYAPGEFCRPTIVFNDKEMVEFVDSFVRELRDGGFRTKIDDEVEGELKATKYHLEDFRRLVFGGKDNASV